jgi:CBS domain containing-hemolysin-like protein
LADEEFDTVGGFLFGVLEHVPVVGETVEVEGWRFVVEALEGRRITEVRLMPLIGTE